MQFLESAAEELERNSSSLDGLASWLLEQRTEIQGPGVGYLDTRELSPRAAEEFQSACMAAFARLSSGAPPPWLEKFGELLAMWTSIAAGNDESVSQHLGV